MRLPCHSGTNSSNNRSSAVFKGLTLYAGGFYISCMGIQYIGLISNFVWVFPHHLTEKPKRTFCPSQYFMLREDRNKALGIQVTSNPHSSFEHSSRGVYSAQTYAKRTEEDMPHMCPCSLRCLLGGCDVHKADCIHGIGTNFMMGFQTSQSFCIRLLFQGGTSLVVQW